MNDAHFVAERSKMIASLSSGRGVVNERVLEAMQEVPRHCFVPETLEQFAYAEGPLAIGSGQTISQPSGVALLTQALELNPGDHVLEVGTGSGYGAAILSKLSAQVHTVERHQRLASAAQRVLRNLRYDNVEVHWADGTQGWSLGRPYDAIVVTAAALQIPHALLDQLGFGARLVMPIGDAFSQVLTRLTRAPNGRLKRDTLGPVRFAPLVQGVVEKQSERSSQSPRPSIAA